MCDFLHGHYLRGVPGTTPSRCGVASHYVRGYGSRGVWSYSHDGVNVRGVQNEQAGVNWRKIKAEYISGRESQRALAEKYGVSRSTLIRRANKEHWTQKRKAADTESEKKVQEKTAEIISDNAVLLERAKTGLLRRVVEMIENYPATSAAEVKTKQNGAILKYSIKDIAAVLSVLEDKSAKGQNADIEDLSPLTELLRDE